MQETQVQSLGWEDPLEKEMATHSSILAWRIPWTEDPDRLQSMGSPRVGDRTEQLHFHLLLQKSSKILLCISLEVEPGSCPKATLLFFDCSSLVCILIPSLISSSLNLPSKKKKKKKTLLLFRWKKTREFQKNIYFCYIDYSKAFDCVDHNKLENY